MKICVAAAVTVLAAACAGEPAGSSRRPTAAAPAETRRDNHRQPVPVWHSLPPSPAAKRARERHAYYCVGQAPAQLVPHRRARQPVPIKRPGAQTPPPTRRRREDAGLCTSACCYGIYLCDEVRRGKRASAVERSWCAANRPPPPPR